MEKPIPKKSKKFFDMLMKMSNEFIDKQNKTAAKNSAMIRKAALGGVTNEKGVPYYQIEEIRTPKKAEAAQKRRRTGQAMLLRPKDPRKKVSPSVM